MNLWCLFWPLAVSFLSFFLSLSLSLFLSLESSSFPLPLDSLVNDVRWITTLITKRNLPPSSFLRLLLLHLLNFLLVHKLRALCVIFSPSFSSLRVSRAFLIYASNNVLYYTLLHVNVCCMGGPSHAPSAVFFLYCSLCWARFFLSLPPPTSSSHSAALHFPTMCCTH